MNAKHKSTVSAVSASGDIQEHIMRIALHLCKHQGIIYFFASLQRFLGRECVFCCSNKTACDSHNHSQQLADRRVFAFAFAFTLAQALKTFILATQL